MKKVTIGIVVIAIFLRLFTLLHYYGWVYERPYTFTAPLCVSVFKDWYEVAEDDTVLIYCTYSITNSLEQPVSFQLGARFLSDHRTFFLQEETLVSDDIYTLEPGEHRTIKVVFEGHRWLASKMWDKNPPIPIVVNSHAEISEAISVEEAVA